MPRKDPDPRCPFCDKPALQADVEPPNEACVDPKCKGAHGWQFDWVGMKYVPWSERRAA
jgi:hypothetical protein